MNASELNGNDDWGGGTATAATTVAAVVDNANAIDLVVNCKDNTITFSENLENWMDLLPDEIINIPIINLAIPGTHDSMTYALRMQKNAKTSPDAERIVRRLNRVAPCVVQRWAITQYLTVGDQLMNGIRYLDLRITVKRDENNSFYFCHSLFCEAIEEPLKQVNSFLENHPNEFIILDFQHFYEFKLDHYQLLTVKLKEIFGDKFYGRHNGPLLDKLTLKRARELKKQVLIIFRNDDFIPIEFWPGYAWQTPWPNTVNCTTLREFLTRSIDARSADAGFVCQCVLTPDAEYIAPRFYSSLRAKCAKPIVKELFDWIKQQTPGKFDFDDKPLVNVFIADFIDLGDYEFSKIVIDLNKKLVINKKKKSSSKTKDGN